jgi:hypothetical protein
MSFVNLVSKIFILMMALGIVCSVTATAPPSSSVDDTAAPATELPQDIPMNWGAGLGNWIIITIRLADGENLPLLLDTGCPTTCLDKSFEPKLGKRIKTDTLWDFGVKSQINLYAAPKLYLKNTLLAKIGPYVVTHDCKEISNDVGQPIMGILGMDVLQNYCIQFDFDAGKIRFLDYDHSNKSRWGTPFDLIEIGDGCFIISNNLAGTEAPGSLIDTGYNQDGWLVPNLFQQWTNQAVLLPNGQVHSPNGILGSQTYAGLNLRGVDPKLFSSGDTHITFNGLGLHFLSRHLVTLDFPEQTLYLKCTSIGPLVDKNQDAAMESAVKSAAKFLKSLEAKGQLPGWSKNDTIASNRITYHYSYPHTVVFDIPKEGDSSIYHYAVFRISNDGPWQLEKAWQTDANGNTVKQYPLP